MGQDMSSMQERYIKAQAAVARKSAEQVKAVFRERKTMNKLDSYRAKLISALSARDKQSVYDIMLQLSSYAQVDLGFMNLLYDDFERHMNLIYGFVNQLNDFEKVTLGEGRQ